MKIVCEKCARCRECEEICPVKAISEQEGQMVIDKNLCLGCGCCAAACSEGAIEFE